MLTTFQFDSFRLSFGNLCILSFTLMAVRDMELRPRGFKLVTVRGVRGVISPSLFCRVATFYFCKKKMLSFLSAYINQNISGDQNSHRNKDARYGSSLVTFYNNIGSGIHRSSMVDSPPFYWPLPLFWQLGLVYVAVVVAERRSPL